jgi:sugar fermentation stimulation protein A
LHFKSDLIKAKILKRYKRFLSDIELDSGEIICAHVPNTGSMKTCWEPGWEVYLTHTDDPKRKLKYTLELVHNGKSFISINTSFTNKIVKEALEKNFIPELVGYQEIRPEKKINESRLDFFLSGENYQDTYVEVKNVTLLGENKMALFPDAVSTRGQKHLKELMKLKEQGYRSIMFYLVNRGDVDNFSVAKHIDPEYAKLLLEAQEKGVEILAYQTKITPKEISLSKRIKVNL